MIPDDELKRDIVRRRRRRMMMLVARLLIFVGLPTLIAPRLIELCFQTAGMYELGVDGRFGLPARIGRVQVLKEPTITGMQLYTVVRHSNGGRGFDADVVDESGDVFLRLQDYRTVELPGAEGGLGVVVMKQRLVLLGHGRADPGRAALDAVHRNRRADRCA